MIWWKKKEKKTYIANDEVRWFVAVIVDVCDQLRNTVEGCDC